MAAVKTRVDTKLQISMDTGEVKNGKAVLRSVTFSKVKNDASADQLLAAGNAFGTLAKGDLDGVKVSEVYTLAAGA